VGLISSRLLEVIQHERDEREGVISVLDTECFDGAEEEEEYGRGS